MAIGERDRPIAGSQAVEPWLRGTHTEIPPVQRAVVHALELAGEDVRRWAFGLSAEEMEIAPFGLPSVAFQVRHIARSLDRLLTYAAGSGLSAGQLAGLQSEQGAGVGVQALREEFDAALSAALVRVEHFNSDALESAAQVGRAGLPTTAAGLLIHVAEHTQRHVGQAITTAKVVIALRDGQQS